MQFTSGWPAGTIARLPATPGVAQLRDTIESLLGDTANLARQSETGLAYARQNTIAKTVDHLLAVIGA
jgi:hypothetical protein